MWAIRMRVEKEMSEPIYVKREVYQGNSISPLLFILLTASIIDHIKTTENVSRVTKENHKILAHMDDIKCYTTSKVAMKTITKELEKAAGEF